MDENANPVWMLSLLLLAATGAQAAKVYSWTDSQGSFTTRMPLPGQKAKEVDLRVAPSSAVPRSVQVDNFNSLTGVDAKKEKEAAKLVIELLSRNRAAPCATTPATWCFRVRSAPNRRPSTMCA